MVVPEELPKTMKGAQGKSFGDVVAQLLDVQDDVPVPRLDDPYEPQEAVHPAIRSATKQDRKTHMILKTLAVALAPGDCRVMSGKTRYFQGPPSFPYIPGGDCCGVVMETMPGETYFQKGDVVAARFTVAPRDAMAECARVSSVVCEKVTDTNKIPPEAAAALASASPAVCVADHIRPNERVLILGAGGGVGSHLCQLARKSKASYICGVSSSPERLLQHPLSCDDAVDYTKEDILESAKYQNQPFDTIVDLSASGAWLKLVENARKRKSSASIVKPASQGGRYITITPDEPTFEAKSMWPLLRLFLFKPLGRKIWYNKLNIFTRKSLPAFVQANGLPANREIISRTLKLAQEGKLQAVVEGPYPMTTDGVRNAFKSLQSRHPKGKVVVQVAAFPTTPTV
mmetsp:Transcript_38147/g.70408  ORF Transcript_38147/g.70408 Transcript_38147/m.70408 type:complete len:400 (-) Transcript_38147:152-1351(-)|eukprot:CAMPEP_0197445860 /NCGR_PEP_ID=MMETSP1175-20131217/10971_1 /TAXON_ID=1003142 /ORGANISM="Triceratium dubium, Strain CCMP147" /LENGTH=399 /DNA_ID=CAMNT_0042976893 /DNA_START=128 /DNA_END=1327 /DNA_ORIENTATION=-